MNMRRLAMILLVLMPTGLWAQNTGLTIATVTRPPFSMIQDGKDSGFSIELWNAVANELGVETTFKRADSFAEMLEMVELEKADGAIANISITASRER
ncbi:MAG: transporter substrate-binding domain-containing protein, partial [Planktomarina sp.]